MTKRGSLGKSSTVGDMMHNGKGAKMVTVPNPEGNRAERRQAARVEARKRKGE